MRLVPLAALALVLVVRPAKATPAPVTCESQIDKVDQAQLIVVARAKSVETGTKDGRYAMRVTYAVDSVLAGAKVAEVAVETTCNPAPIKPDDDRADRAGRCSVAENSMLGLKEDGSVGTAPAVLVLADTTSVLDGKPVYARLRGAWWEPCRDEIASLAKRPKLKAVLDKARATNEKTTSGFVMPPPPPPPAASSAPPPPPASPPAKRGCTMSPGDATSVWPLLALVFLRLRRRPT